MDKTGVRLYYTKLPYAEYLKYVSERLIFTSVQSSTSFISEAIIFTEYSEDLLLFRKLLRPTKTCKLLKFYVFKGDQISVKRNAQYKKNYATIIKTRNSSKFLSIFASTPLVSVW